MLDTFTRQNVIGRLRVAGTNVDALSARLRAERLLNTADLEAAQPTPSAIVFIRKLRDPLPGVLRLDSSATEPPAEWKAALTNTLRSVAGRAGRPAVEAVSGNEDAIIFADRAELLACLAADSCRGATATRWWWTCLLRAGHDLHAIKKIWSDSPEYIPAALHHLSKRHLAVTFVERLDDDSAHQFVRAITNVFGLQWLMPAVADRLVLISSSHAAATVVEVNKEVSRAAPWAGQVTNAVTTQLSFEQQRLLGIALMVQQSPAVVRSREFAREVKQWQEQVVMDVADCALSTTRPRVEQPRTAPEISTSSLPRVHPLELASPVEESDESRIQTPESPVVEPLASMTAESPESISSEVVTGPLLEPAHAISEHLERPESIGPDATPDVPLSTTPDLAGESISETIDLSEETNVILVETELGGLFYLINLGVYLHLYSDFTSPLSPGIELNIWDFVALAGSELLDSPHSDDPIWAALANLARRDEDEPPGQNFESVDRWLSEQMPYVRERLRDALGLKSDDEIAGTLCLHHAMVRITDTHVDVYFSLADLPLAIRFAGLDRDPGWVPAAGRFIKFHFD